MGMREVYPRRVREHFEDLRDRHGQVCVGVCGGGGVGGVGVGVGVGGCIWGVWVCNLPRSFFGVNYRYMFLMAANPLFLVSSKST